jgi:hypothetical protein
MLKTSLKIKIRRTAGGLKTDKTEGALGIGHSGGVLLQAGHCWAELGIAKNTVFGTSRYRTLKPAKIGEKSQGGANGQMGKPFFENRKKRTLAWPCRKKHGQVLRKRAPIRPFGKTV